MLLHLDRVNFAELLRIIGNTSNTDMDILEKVGVFSSLLHLTAAILKNGKDNISQTTNKSSYGCEENKKSNFNYCALFS